jgi:hypothetical protein
MPNQLLTIRETNTTMSHQDPSSIPIVSYLWVIGLSLLSSVAGFLSRFLSDKPPSRPILALIMDVSYSLLAGLTTYFMGQASELPEMTIIVLVCIGSHMGARLLFSMQRLVQKQIRATLAVEEEG